MGRTRYRFGEAFFPHFLTCTLEILERQELCANRVVGCRQNRLVIQRLETTRSVEDGIPTPSVGTSQIFD